MLLINIQDKCSVLANSFLLHSTAKQIQATVNSELSKQQMEITFVKTHKQDYYAIYSNSKIFLNHQLNVKASQRHKSAEYQQYCTVDRLVEQKKKQNTGNLNCPQMKVFQ